MSDELPPEFNLFRTNQLINQKLDALMRRATPATQAELAQLSDLLKDWQARQQTDAAQLLQAVQVQMQPLARFDEAALAQRLVAAISQQLPTPTGLTQAGEQAARTIRQAMEVTVSQTTTQARQAVTEVQGGVQALKGTAGEIRKILAENPLKAKIDFFRLKRDVAIVLGMGAAAMLLLVLVLYALVGGFSQVSREEYDTALDDRNKCARALEVILTRRERLMHDYPQIAVEYFPNKNDPKPVATQRVTLVPKPLPKKPTRKRHR